MHALRPVLLLLLGACSTEPVDWVQITVRSGGAAAQRLTLTAPEGRACNSGFRRDAPPFPGQVSLPPPLLWAVSIARSAPPDPARFEVEVEVESPTAARPGTATARLELGDRSWRSPPQGDAGSAAGILPQDRFTSGRFVLRGLQADGAPDAPRIDVEGRWYCRQGVRTDLF